MEEIPKPGDALNLLQVQMIAEGLAVRAQKFPEEDIFVSLSIVLFNLGEQYVTLTCVAGEWSGRRADIPESEGLPKCPNGHVLTQEIPLRLGWIEEVR